MRGWTLIPALTLWACHGDDSKTPSHTGETSSPDWACLIEDGSDPDFTQQLGCEADFEALSSEPADASIPGATSVKTVIDRSDDYAL